MLALMVALGQYVRPRMRRIFVRFMSCARDRPLLWVAANARLNARIIRSTERTLRRLRSATRALPVPTSRAVHGRPDELFIRDTPRPDKLVYADSPQEGDGFEPDRILRNALTTRSASSGVILSSASLPACTVVSRISAAFMPDYTGKEFSMEYDHAA
jgi:hypothetical protein